MIGWFVPPQNGTCTKGSSMRTHVALGPGTYGLAIGCPACHYASVRVGVALDEELSAPDQLTSIEQAVRYLSSALDIPVALPSDLPAGARIDEEPVDLDRSAETGRLKLRFGRDGILIFDFGRSGFDGCGGDGAIETEVNGEPALMLAKDKYPWAQIIWPARPGDSEATYGIYGSLRASAMLELARSTPPTEVEASRQSPGCL
jgi:hypothetical protein